MIEPAVPHPPLTSSSLLSAIATFLSNNDDRTLDEIRRSVGDELDRAGTTALLQLDERLAADSDWAFYPPDPLARRIHAVLADTLLETGSGVRGVEHAAAVAGHPVVIFANHLSYADANLIAVLLSRAGAPALAERLTAMAGPKVYSSRRRRFSSLCFGTIKTPQNSGVSSDEATMPARDVARAARRTIALAHERLRAGDALLLFAEGTRSRSHEMQRLLPGAARYLEGPPAWVLPMSITGTEAMFPIGDDTLHRVRIDVTIGPAIDARTLREHAGGDRRLMMDAVGLAVAGLLPPDYRGVYADTTGELAPARAVLTSIPPSTAPRARPR